MQWIILNYLIGNDDAHAKNLSFLVSGQSLPEFFVHPQRPDHDSYRLYRDYLLETSQIPGGFYASRARAPALRLVVDMMLAPHDPYDALAFGRAETRQQRGSDSR